METYCHEALRRFTSDADGKLMVVGGVDDHVHQLSAIRPKISVSDHIKQIKRRTTRALKREFEHLQNFAWQEGFAAFTVDPFQMDWLAKYIRNQKKHHAREDLRAEMEWSAGSGSGD